MWQPPGGVPVRRSETEQSIVNEGRLADSAATTRKIADNAVTSNDSLFVADASGTSTTSTSQTDIPGFSVTFSLAASYDVIVWMRVNALAIANPADTEVGVKLWLVQDGTNVRDSIVWKSGASDISGIQGDAVVVHKATLAAGSHTYKGSFAIYHGTEVDVYWRELLVLVTKR